MCFMWDTFQSKNVCYENTTIDPWWLNCIKVLLFSLWDNLSSISGLWRVAVGQIVQHHRGPPKPQQFLFPFWRDYSARDLPSNASTRGTRNDQNVIKLSRVTWKNKQQEVYLQKINICVYIYTRIYLYTYTFKTTNWSKLGAQQLYRKLVCSYEKIDFWKADRWTWRTRDPGTCQQCVCAWNTFDKPKTFQKIAFFVYIYHIRYIRSISFLSAFCYDAN